MARAKRKSRTAKAKRKSRTPLSTRSAPREEQYADPEETHRPPFFGQREPTRHIVTEKIRLLKSLYAEGVQDGIRLALGERTIEEIQGRSRREASQYMDGVLAGAAYIGRRSQYPPTDDSLERRAGHFLYRVMRRHPEGIWDEHNNYRDKDELQEYCFKKFGIGPRAYERLRPWAIYRAAADAYYKRRGPRGPHKRERVHHVRRP